MPSDPENPLRDLEDAIEIYLDATSDASSQGSRDELLEQHGDLRELLEPLFDEDVDDAEDEGIARTLADYRMVREIGRGGMGVVHEAVQLSLGRTVALKVLPEFQALSSDAIARFRREAAAIAKLDHPGIVKVLSVGTDEDTHFYAMEFLAAAPVSRVLDRLREVDRSELDGPRLRNAIVESRHLPSRGEPMSIGTVEWPDSYYRAVAVLGAQIAEALECAHSHGVVHRDVKPANLLIRVDGSVVLTDFGLARNEDLPGITMSGAFAGTPRYAAPEQIEGVLDRIDGRTDVFSLGATLYEMLTLENAFEGDSARAVIHSVLEREPVDPTRLNRAVPRDLAAIVMRAIEKDPADRYQSAAACARDLRAFIGHRPVQARRPTVVGRVRRWVRRNALVTAAFSVTVVSLVLGLTVVIAALLRADDAARRAQTDLQFAFEAIDELTEFAHETLAPYPELDDARRGTLQSLLQFHQEFLARRGDDPAVRFEIAKRQIEAGQVLGQLGEVDEADVAFGVATRLLVEIVADEPLNAEALANLGRARAAHAYVIRDRTDRAQRAPLIQAAVDGLELACARDPRVEFRRWFAYALWNAGRLAQERLDNHEAIDWFDRAVTIQRRIFAESPESIQDLKALSATLHSRGRSLAMAVRYDAAIESLVEARVVFDGHAQSGPTSGEVRYQATVIDRSIGKANIRARKYDAARVALHRGLAAARELAADYPRVPAYRLAIAGFLNSLGQVAQQQGQPKHQAELADEAIPIVRRCYREARDSRNAVTELHHAYLNSMRAHVRLEQHAAAASRSAEYLDIDVGSIESFVLAVETLVDCARVVDLDHDIEAARRSTVREEYHARALEVLRTAAERELFDVAVLRAERFDRLRELPEFRKVEAILERARTHWRYDHECPVPVPARFMCGQTPEQIDALAAEGWRVVDLELESEDASRFAVALVRNEGSHRRRWAWLADSSAVDVDIMRRNGYYRVADLNSRAVAGEVRHSALFVDNGVQHNRRWFWHFDRSLEDHESAIRRLKSRFVEIDFYSAGEAEYAAVASVDAMGKDRRHWQLRSTYSDENEVRRWLDDGWTVVDLDRDASGRVWCVLTLGPRIEQRVWLDRSESELQRQLVGEGMRITSFASWGSGSERRYDAVMVPNR